MTSLYKKYSKKYSEKELPSFVGEVLSRAPKKGPVWVFLEGPLGAGKSTLVRFFLNSLCVKKGNGGSPTFPLVHESIMKHGRKSLHIDLYRLNSPDEIFWSGIEESILEANGWVFIEWIDRFPNWTQSLLRSKDLRTVFKIKIDFSEEADFRIISIE